MEHVRPMIPLSILDLVRITRDTDAGGALDNARDLALHAEALGYHRIWVAEHHNLPGIASAATSVVIAHIAGGTKTIRVGAGGIMLPNHAPLVIAEQFGTLAALHPGRIDLGLGRAPGSDMRVARALRRGLSADPEGFPHDVVELQALFRGDPELGIRAVPGAGEVVEMWILGSSLYGAQLAALLGLPFAFASHFAPDHLDQALAIYRRDFRPSATLDRPYVMCAMGLYVADDDAGARALASSMERVFVELHTTGRTRPLAPPDPRYRDSLNYSMNAMLDKTMSTAAIGSPVTAKEKIKSFIDRTNADEIIFSSAIYDVESDNLSRSISSDICSSFK